MTSRPERSEKDSYREIVADIRLRIGRSTTVVFTNGCFDLLHPGHLGVLQECRKIAGPHGVVVVGVNSDASVERIKGPGRPIMDADARATTLVHLKTVDYAITFDEDTPLKLIEALRPDVIVKGAEYRGKEVVGSHLAVVSFAETVSDWSTTRIVERCRL